MEIKEFATKVCRAIERELGENYTTEVKEVTKNNGVVLLGLMIKQTMQTMLPTIYLDHFWRAYEEGTPLSVIVDRLIRIYLETPKVEVDMDFFNTYENVKDRICYRLIEREKNQAQLKELPHVDYFDLAICFFYAYENEALGEGAIMLRNTHLERWGIDIPELYERASVNTPILFPWQCKSMNTMLGEVQEVMPEGELDLVLEELPMLVLSNTINQYGAGCILYPGLLERLALNYGYNYYILPSSVHEVILLRDSGEEDEEMLKSMIRQINEEYVDKEDILSDNLYHYNFEKRAIRKIE